MKEQYAMIEQEVILLRSVYDHISGMVNHLLLDVLGEDPNSEVKFKDIPHHRLFFILLVDFLSTTDGSGPIKKTSFLQGLSDVCDEPQFSVGESENELEDAVQHFRDWLREEKRIDIWMPSIDKEINVSISRMDFIKMSGNISKHNYLRAIGVAKQLQKILKNSKVTIDLDQALLVLPDFYEKFDDDILIYHTSCICEFLNNIIWGIYTYLEPEYRRSLCYVKPEVDGPPHPYRYDVPQSIKSEYANDSYWELMNKVRRKPYVRKFIVTEWLKMRY